MKYQHGLIAAAIMHMEGAFSTKALANRCNNPGNLRHTPPAYDMYPDKLTGFRALVDDIAANSGSKLGEFIFKYAPPAENNTSMYMDVVEAVTGLGPDTLIE